MEVLTEGNGAWHGPPAAVACPQGCGEAFDCDACLHVHLMRNYRLRYADVFGAHSDAWLDFCDAHQGCSPSVLGL